MKVELKEDEFVNLLNMNIEKYDNSTERNQRRDALLEADKEHVNRFSVSESDGRSYFYVVWSK